MNLRKMGRLRELDDVFADYGALFGRSMLDTPEVTDATLRWRPRTDISETAAEYIIKAELPEVRREDVEVSVDSGMLRIEGKREWKKEADDEKQHRRESFYGSFARAFTLPQDVDEARIRAQCKDGMLTVRLPKREQAEKKARQIEVS